MFVHSGELWSPRQALEGAALAPGNQATLNALTGDSRRPAQLRDPLPDRLLNLSPRGQISVGEGSGGPSGMDAVVVSVGFQIGDCGRA